MKWFKNLRVRPKLLICFDIVITFAIVLAAMAVTTLNRIDTTATPTLSTSRKTASAFTGNRYGLRHLTANPDGWVSD